MFEHERMRLIIQQAAAVCLLLSRFAGRVAERPNILFIAVDDLRPEPGCVHSTAMVRRNVDSASGQCKATDWPEQNS